MNRLPIEPLDKAKWERIERALEQRLEHAPPAPARERARWLPIIAIAGAAAAAAVVATLAVRERPAPITARPSPPPATTVIETEDAPSHLAVGSSSLDVGPRSSARIEGNDDSGFVVALDHGAVECEVAPRHGRPPFIVHAGDVSVRVVGTHFRVEHDVAGTHVTVSRGVVEVEEHGTTTSVGAGSSWPNPVATIPPAPPPPPVSPPKTVVQPNTSASVAAPTSARDRYDHALALEMTQPDESLRVYRELAQGDGSWAMNALYAEARLELERGDKDAARDHFAEYVRRFPSGPNAADARDMYAKLK